jgi:hypothetical protein
MEINPQEIIKQLSSEIARLNVEVAILKTALEQVQNGTTTPTEEKPN